MEGLFPASNPALRPHLAQGAEIASRVLPIYGRLFGDLPVADVHLISGPRAPGTARRRAAQRHAGSRQVQHDYLPQYGGVSAVSFFDSKASTERMLADAAMNSTTTSPISTSTNTNSATSCSRS